MAFGGAVGGTKKLFKVDYPWSIWFWIFLAFSLGLLGVGIKELWDGWRTQRWVQTACVIIHSAAETKPDGRYFFTVCYRYQFQGHEYVSYRAFPGREITYSDFAPLQAMLSQYPNGARSVCYVNPEHPNEAVLGHDSNYGGSLFVAPFPMFLWALFNMHSLSEWWERRKREKPERDQEPISDNRPLVRLRWRGIFIGLLTVVMGLAFAAWTIVQPLRQNQQARQWERTPCIILSSDVQTESHPESWSYHPRVLYAYSFRGQEYKSSQFDFSGSLGDSYSDTVKAISAFPAGLHTYCYVDPQNSEQAVLDRSMRVEWFSALFSFVILGSGIFLVSGLFWPMLDGSRKQKHFTGLPWHALKHPPASRTLQPEKPARVCIAGFAFLALVCVAISIPLLLKAGKSLLMMHLDVLPGLCGVFGIVGAGAALKRTPKYFAAALNPPPTLRIQPGVLTLGVPAKLEWQFHRKMDGLLAFRIFLEGHEKAKVLVNVHSHYGTVRDEQPRKRCFASLPVVELFEDRDFCTGKAVVLVPSDTMHSFEGIKTRITWSLRVEMETVSHQWVEHEFKIFVMPASTITA